MVRPGQVLVCGEANPPASVLAVAAARGAHLLRLGVEFQASVTGDTVKYVADDLELNLPLPNLPGPHQISNLATGLAAVLSLIPQAATERPALVRGLRAVRLAGRLERIADGPALWLDVGHNAMAARAVAAALAGIRSAEGIKNFRCVIGMLADKDAAAAVAELKEIIGHWYCASLPGSRGQAGEQLAARIAVSAGDSPLQVFDGVESALRAALADAAPEDGVLVFGSFLTASAAGKLYGAWARREVPGPVATSHV